MGEPCTRADVQADGLKQMMLILWLPRHGCPDQKTLLGPVYRYFVNLAAVAGRHVIHISPMTSEVLAEVLAGTPAKAKQSDSALGTVVMYRSGELQKLHTEQDSQYYCEFVILNWSSAPESFFVQLDGAVSCLHCVGW